MGVTPSTFAFEGGFRQGVKRIAFDFLLFLSKFFMLAEVHKHRAVYCLDWAWNIILLPV